MKIQNQQPRKTWNRIQYDVYKKSSSANFISTTTVQKKNMLTKSTFTAINK